MFKNLLQTDKRIFKVILIIISVIYGIIWIISLLFFLDGYLNEISMIILLSPSVPFAVNIILRRDKQRAKNLDSINLLISELANKVSITERDISRAINYIEDTKQMRLFASLMELLGSDSISAAATEAYYSLQRKHIMEQVSGKGSTFPATEMEYIQFYNQLLEKKCILEETIAYLEKHKATINKTELDKIRSTRL